MKNKNIKEITVKIEGKEWEEALDKAYEKASKNVKIDKISLFSIDYFVHICYIQ